MENLSPFCTCSCTTCPHHPTNHDKGCMPCIVKNLGRGEIPGCFFNAVDASYPGPDYYYADFARLVASKGAPGAADALTCIRTRRSCRRFLPDAVPKDLLAQVVEAGRCAPTGGNSQSFRFFVVTDPAVLSRLASLVQDAFAGMEAVPGMYGSLVSSITQARRGNYVFHYNAPAFIIVTNRIDYPNAMADSACALQNMMLAAHALGLGSCWINQLHWLDSASGMTGTHPALDDYLHSLGLSPEEQICGCLSVGFPDAPSADLPRKSEVVYI